MSTHSHRFEHQQYTSPIEAQEERERAEAAKVRQQFLSSGVLPTNVPLRILLIVYNHLFQEEL